jgi:hypothetical protein
LHDFFIFIFSFKKEKNTCTDSLSSATHFNIMMLWIALILYVFLDSSQGQVKMVKDQYGEDPVNPPPCLITCAGSTGLGKTEWTGRSGRVQTTVDISHCAFTTTPIVTTSLNGDNTYNYNGAQVGMTSPHGLTKDKFGITLFGQVLTAESNHATWEPSPEDLI